MLYFLLSKELQSLKIELPAPPFPNLAKKKNKIFFHFFNYLFFQNNKFLNLLNRLSH